MYQMQHLFGHIIYERCLLAKTETPFEQVAPFIIVFQEFLSFIWQVEYEVTHEC